MFPAGHQSPSHDVPSMSISVTFLTCDKNAPQKQPKGERLILTHDLKGGEDMEEQNKALTSGWWGNTDTKSWASQLPAPPYPLFHPGSQLTGRG